MRGVMRKTCLRDFRPGQTKTGLHSHRRLSEALNFRFRNKRHCNIYVAKSKGADQLRDYCASDLHLCFCICKSMFSHEAHTVKFLNFWTPTDFTVNTLKIQT